MGKNAFPALPGPEISAFISYRISGSRSRYTPCPSYRCEISFILKSIHFPPLSIQIFPAKSFIFKLNYSKKKWISMNFSENQILLRWKCRDGPTGRSFRLKVNHFRCFVLIGCRLLFYFLMKSTAGGRQRRWPSALVSHLGYPDNFKLRASSGATCWQMALATNRRSPAGHVSTCRPPTIRSSFVDFCLFIRWWRYTPQSLFSA